MKSFSRSASPVILSASSSQISLNNYNPVPTNNPPIYEYLEKLTEPQIYRSRLNTAVSNKSQEAEDSCQSQNIMTRRSDAVSPQVVEPVQYASLMKELQRAIVCKKEPPSVTSPLSNSESHSKSSDAEFSKELEAALQLIQDLESPNTAETPFDPPISRPLTVSDSEKTLSALGSMNEIASPPIGKGTNRVLVRYPDSQSTSGYSSPSHGPTPNWSTTSSINGSNQDIVRPVSYHIHNDKSSTVISLYTNNDHSKGKSVTLVNISGPIHNSTLVNCPSPKLPHEPLIVSKPDPATGLWNVKSLLRKKKQVARLCPELESAIIKSESLAYLSEVELMARARRNEQIQRQIEERVSQQLGVPRTESESNC
ncbi:unnamed protein product [Ceutorhynchus assimilis]|uniref:Uncharacterized protein n=1 Tax=Ceutorhynchus assimilis TaxID=467358 RepID=A0A9N9MGR9_9CUCU|nr:unnamed protein product [Ceutorhynchus assimilis]